MLAFVVVLAIALFVGVRSERARQAHQNWQMYKTRIATMRGLRMKETMRAVLGFVALLAVLQVVIHL